MSTFGDVQIGLAWSLGYTIKPLSTWRHAFSGLLTELDRYKEAELYVDYRKHLGVWMGGLAGVAELPGVPAGTASNCTAHATK